MKKIAVIGSRAWPRPQDVALCVNTLYGKHGQFILVSGGGDPGTTNHMAETTASEFGLPVVSFRPVKFADFGTDEQYGVDEWRLYHGAGKIIRHDISFADWPSAASYRSALIAERADEGVAFWDGHSRGTSYEIDCFAAEGKVLRVFKLTREGEPLV